MNAKLCKRLRRAAEGLCDGKSEDSKTRLGTTACADATGGKVRPPVSILDSTFRYFDSANTNVKRTFVRVRLAQKEAARLAAESAAKPTTVTPMVRKTGGAT